jgi:hypothetical protein
MRNFQSRFCREIVPAKPTLFFAAAHPAASLPEQSARKIANPHPKHVS